MKVDTNLVILIVVMICIIAGIMSQYLGMGSGNPIETVAEEVIQKETGIDINLNLPSQETDVKDSEIPPLPPQEPTTGS